LNPSSFFDDLIEQRVIIYLNQTNSVQGEVKISGIVKKYAKPFVTVQVGKVLRILNEYAIREIVSAQVVI
jgi:hypothetical protein